MRAKSAMARDVTLNQLLQMQRGMFIVMDTFVNMCKNFELKPLYYRIGEPSAVCWNQQSSGRRG